LPDDERSPVERDAPEARTRSDPEADPASEPEDVDALVHIRRFARGSMVLLSSGVVSYVGAFALTVLLARVIGTEAFGAWAIGFATAQLLSTVGLIGADWIVLRQGSYYESIGDAARFRRTIHVALGLSGAGLVLLGGSVFVAAEPLATRVFHTPAIAPILRLTGLVTPIMGIRQVLIFGTQAFKEMRDAAVNRNLLQPIIRILFVAIALAFGRSALSAYVALVLAEIVLAAAAAWVLNRRISLLGRTEGVNGRGLVGFAVPAWLTRLAGQGRAQLFPVLLGSLASIASSGVFVVTTRISLAPTAVVNAMNQVYTPIGSDLYLHDRRAELAELYKSTTKWMFTLAFPLVALMAAFPAPLLSLFGPGFRGGDAALVVMAFGVLFQFGTGPVTVTLILIGRPRLALLDYVFVVVLEIGLAVWLIPTHGLLGAAIAKAVGTALNNVVPLIQVWSITGSHPFRLDFWKPVVAGAVAVGAAKLVSEITGFGGGIRTVLLAGVIVGVVYLALIVLFGLEEQDRAIVQGIFRRRSAASDHVITPVDGPAQTFDEPL
jgi:O-antigen/teichoic acid export membrane protein